MIYIYIFFLYICIFCKITCFFSLSDISKYTTPTAHHIEKCSNKPEVIPTNAFPLHTRHETLKDNGNFLSRQQMVLLPVCNCLLHKRNCLKNMVGKAHCYKILTFLMNDFVFAMASIVFDTFSSSSFSS